MTAEYGPAVTALGIGLPGKVLTNQEIAEQVETSDQWIRDNVGIRERRIATEGETTGTFATLSARHALAMISPRPANLGIIVATATPDYQFPATACLVQDRLGYSGLGYACELGAACAGSIYGLAENFSFLKSGYADNSLSIGAETLSKIVDWNDRDTCILFGDGAGAALIQNIRDPGIAEFVLNSDGSKADYLKLPGGGSKHPPSIATIEEKLHYIKMVGWRILGQAVRRMCEASKQVLDKAKLTIDDISLVIPHQANIRIMNDVWDKLAVPESKRFSNIDRYGNTSAASVYIAWYEAVKEGRLHKDEIVLLTAFGAGLSWGAAVIQSKVDEKNLQACAAM